MATPQTKFNKHHQPIVKSPLILRNETNDKIAAIRKRLESELIVRLLRLEKSQKPLPRPKTPPEGEPAEVKRAGRQGRGPRRQRQG